MPPVPDFKTPKRLRTPPKPQFTHPQSTAPVPILCQSVSTLFLSGMPSQYFQNPSGHWPPLPVAVPEARSPIGHRSSEGKPPETHSSFTGTHPSLTGTIKSNPGPEIPHCGSARKLPRSDHHSIPGRNSPITRVTPADSGPLIYPPCDFRAKSCEKGSSVKLTSKRG